MPARKEAITGHVIEWLIRLELEGGTVGWYEFVSINVSVL